MSKATAYQTSFFASSFYLTLSASFRRATVNAGAASLELEIDGRRSTAKYSSIRSRSFPDHEEENDLRVQGNWSRADHEASLAGAPGIKIN